MVTNQSTLFSKARKEEPKDAQAISHKLLTRAGYIDQLASGVFSLLPLGFAVNQKIIDIVREEMNKIGALEVFLPTLQPTTLWEESGRLTTMDPPLFRTQDRHEKEFVLGSTHEEVVTDLARKNIESYKDLPVSIYQIQTKFRNEMRFTGGLLRVREFQMKDLYSFHSSMDDLNSFYQKVQEAYMNIFKRVDLKAYKAKADSGTIGGAVSHEFSIEAESGEDKVVVCTKCDFAANTEVLKDDSEPCPECGGALEIKSCIENGHTFQLGTKYSDKMGALFTDEDGNRQPIMMGCYGIGIGRLMAAIVETHSDDKGVIWPQSVTPFDLHVIGLQPSVMEKAKAFAEEAGKKVSVLFDDRTVSAGQKFAESDLIGIPTKVVFSEKNEKDGVIEIADRRTGGKKHLSIEKFLASLA